MGNVVYDENRPGVLHHAVVAIVRLQINWQQRRVPVISDEDQISIAVADSAAWNVPRDLNGMLQSISTRSKNDVAPLL